MNPIEIAHFLEEVIRSEAKVIAFFVMGVVIAVVGVYFIRKWVFPRADTDKLKSELASKELEIARKEIKLTELDHKLEDRDRKIAGLKEKSELVEERHARERAALQEQNAELSKTCEDLKDDTVELASQADEARQRVEQGKKDHDLFYRKAVATVAKYKTRVVSLEEQILSLSGQMRQVEEQEGRFWESPVRAAIPPFRDLNGKNPAIIAVTNLKGGVGKTTLTANIAASFCQMGKRVLVVDLDHQTSLTSLCLTVEQMDDLRPGAGKFINNVLKAPASFASVAWDNLTRINDDSFILAASKELAEIEEHVKAKWLLNSTGFDSRYILRAALHAEIIQGRFDVILLDCPPRPSTCLINALTACDYVLVPAKPDKTSTETVPYLLGWLKKLRERNVCPNLEILGVVANQTYRRKNLITREKAVWEELTAKCNHAWGKQVHPFAHFVPNSTQFAEAAATNTFAASHPNLESIFTDLIAEVLERKAHHENCRVATVS